jgi:hypothetical protein
MKLIAIQIKDYEEESVRERFQERSEVRCENCRYWSENKGFHRNYRSGKCEAADRMTGEPMAASIAEYGYDSYLMTKPDFFCALFEEK